MKKRVQNRKICKRDYLDIKKDHKPICDHQVAWEDFNPLTAKFLKIADISKSKKNFLPLFLTMTFLVNLAL